MTEADDKSLFLKTPHARGIELEEKKLVLILKLDFYWLDFILLEDSMHPSGKKSNHQSYTSVITGLARCTHQCNECSRNNQLPYHRI